MHRREFDYALPGELIAQTPLAERSASRLLVLDRESGVYEDRLIRNLPDLLAPGDLLVFNDTRVVAARLMGAKHSGGRVEMLLERALDSRRALVQVHASKPLREGLEIETRGGVVRVLDRQGDLWSVETPEDVLPFFEKWGEVPLPPYIRREATADDRERYQSIFAAHPGAVAAPTASLHFDPALVAALEARGVRRAFVTLHVGAGTFQPLRVDEVEAHVMHAESVRVEKAACDAIRETRASGGRVVAVGTTVARALESAVREGALHTFEGDTRLFIYPGFRFRIVDALLTNFHLPQSTLLMLVAAFAGREAVLNAYHHAVRERYRFFSYGDAMLILPPRRA